MKKVFALLFSLTFLAGCHKDTDCPPAEMPVGGVISLHSDSGSEGGTALKAVTGSDEVADDRLTYVFEAWTRDANPRCVLHKTVTGTYTEAVIEIILVPGAYDFLFWADHGDEYYVTDNLRQVKIAMTPGSSPATYVPSGRRDAFACVQTDVVWNGGNGMSAILVRPLAKLIIRNKTEFVSAGKEVSVTYKNVPIQYDVLAGAASVPTDLTLAFPTTEAGSFSVAEDFLFVPSEGIHVGLTISVDDVSKEAGVLPLKPNYTTTVTGSFE
ncbi:MAG: hypothetical protein J6K28_03475 [Alistipes sp.]|nr:hypothetical protein [Alistipes sp.]